MSRPDDPVRVQVTPRAGRDGIDGVVDGRLRVRVVDGRLWVSVVAPVDSAANAAVERLVAEALGISPSSVATIRGAPSRLKVIAIKGLLPGTITTRWPDLVV